MEKGAERQRGGENEGVEENGAVERKWGEEEVLALASVWNEVGAQHVAESRTAFDLISERLRRLSVVRSWWECKAKCRSLGLQSKTHDAAAGSSANDKPGVDGRPEAGWEEEVDRVGNQRGVYPSSVTTPMQEGARTRICRTLPSAPNVAEEGGRHWTDDEVRALLCVWADRRIRERLKCTLRNKPIFQEMAQKMQTKFGVVRNWKQCRTKYKNMKYDYKTARSAHTAGDSSSGGPGKYMKFYDEVEAILMDRELDSMTLEMQVYGGEMGAGSLQTTTQAAASESEIVIEIDDDDNSDDYDMDGDMEVKWRGSDTDLTLNNPSSSEQFNVVTVSDTSRNWSDQEVRALVQIWADKHIGKQLESSTRKRDIFVQISDRLMQQGIERDWKQCHTKYKNLKYVYRCLQRGKTDDADPRRLMRFYDEVDAIMNRTTNGSQCDAGAADNQLDSGLRIVDDCRKNDHGDICLSKSTMTGAPEERSPSSGSVSSICTDVSSNKEELKLFTVHQLDVEKQHRLMSPSENENANSACRGMKRIAVDQEPTLQTPAKKLSTGLNFADKETAQCKEEQDPIQIIKINSVRSMACNDPPPKRE